MPTSTRTTLNLLHRGTKNEHHLHTSVRWASPFSCQQNPNCWWFCQTVRHTSAFDCPISFPFWAQESHDTVARTRCLILLLLRPFQYKHYCSLFPFKLYYNISFVSFLPFGIVIPLTVKSSKGAALVIIFQAPFIGTSR